MLFSISMQFNPLYGQRQNSVLMNVNLNLLVAIIIGVLYIAPLPIQFAPDVDGYSCFLLEIKTLTFMISDDSLDKIYVLHDCVFQVRF